MIVLSHGMEGVDIDVQVIVLSHVVMEGVDIDCTSL